MSNTMQPKDQTKRNHDRFVASSKLEGIELTDRQNAMFDLFTLRGWSAEQCVTFLKEYHNDHCV